MTKSNETLTQLVQAGLDAAGQEHPIVLDWANSVAKTIEPWQDEPRMIAANMIVIIAGFLASKIDSNEYR